MKTKQQIYAHERYLFRISNPENVEKMKQRKKEWVKNNSDKNKETLVRFYENNPDKKKEYAEKYKETRNIKARERYKQNREKEIARSLKYNQEHLENTRRLRKEHHKRIRNTVKGRLSQSMRGGINYSLKLKGSRKWCSWINMVDYTIDQLKTHLEKQFTPKMNWDNYGTYWHIDHKIPIAYFDFKSSDDVGFKLCWALKNLQPLEKIANMKKGAKIDSSYLPLLAVGG